MCAGRQQIRADEDALALATADGPRYARHVGRIGALAVALGVGVAVATGQGIGLARADEGGSASDSGASAAASTDAPADTSSETSAAGPTTPSTATEPDSSPQHGSATPGTSAPEMNVASSGGALTSEHHLAEVEAEEPESHEPAPTATDEHLTTTPEPPVHSRPTPNTSTGGSIPDTVETRPEQTQRRATAVEPADAHPTVSRLSNPAAPSLLSAPTVTVPTISAAAPDETYTDPVQALAAIPGTLVSVATSFVGALLAPFLASGPAAPTQPPLLWTVLAWVRREFQRSFFNETPSATAQSVTTPEDTSVSIDVTADGFADGDGDPVTVKSVTQGAHGTVTVDAAGKVVYTPDENYSGTDTFTITVTDVNGAPHVHGLLGLFTNAGHTTTSTVTVTVSGVNDAPDASDDTVSTTEDTPVSGNVLTNDTDPDTPKSALTAALQTGPLHGTATINSDGTFTYAPSANWYGTDTFTYTVSDGTLTDLGTVTVTVLAVNDAPVGNPDTADAVDNGPTITGNVLTNDTDVDDTVLTVQDPGTFTTSLGTLALNANGNFTYNPTFGADGVDVFTYTVSDPHGALSTSTLTITVTAHNDAPTGPASITVSVDEFTPATGNLLDGYSDANGDDLDITVTGTPQYGTLVVDHQTGEYTYTPDNLGNGEFTDALSVTVSDGRGGTVTTPLTFVVTGHNQVFQNPGTISYTTDEDTAVSGHLFDWAHDPDGDQLHVTVSTSIQQLQYGTLVLNEDTGAFTYTPHVNLAAGESLVDRVTYTMDDRHGVYRSGTLQFTVTGVNDAPTAANDGYGTNEGQTGFASVAIGLLANDSDSDGDTITAELVRPATYGTVSLNADGSFTYTTAPGFTGPDTFTYRAVDSHGAVSTEATVLITVFAVSTV